MGTEFGIILKGWLGIVLAGVTIGGKDDLKKEGAFFGGIGGAKRAS